MPPDPLKAAIFVMLYHPDVHRNHTPIKPKRSKVVFQKVNRNLAWSLENLFMAEIFLFLLLSSWCSLNLKPGVHHKVSTWLYLLQKWCLSSNSKSTVLHTLAGQDKDF